MKMNGMEFFSLKSLVIYFVHMKMSILLKFKKKTHTKWFIS